MDDKAESKNKKLKALQKMFAARLPEIIESLSKEWINFTIQFPAKLEVEIFHREIHTLAGTAGSFGFDEIGKKAKQIELLLIAFLKEPENKIMFDELEKLVTELLGPSLPEK